MRPIPALLSALLALLTMPAQLPAQGLLETSPSPAFVANKGQWSEEVRFQRRAGGGTCFFTETGFTMVFVQGVEQLDSIREFEHRDDDREPEALGVALKLELVDAHPRTVLGEGELPGRYHYLLGNDETKWTRDAAGFARVRYVEAWPGIDVVVRQYEGLFEYDLEVAPGADLGRAQVRCFGGDRVIAMADGSIEVETPIGVLHHAAPVSWTIVAGTGVPADVAATLDGETIRFAANDWDRLRPLVIDPGLVWGAYVGGGVNEMATDADESSSGLIAVVGHALSNPFPTTPGAFQTNRFGLRDAFVSVFTTDGSAVLFQTLFGGMGEDVAVAAAFDAQDQVVFAGRANSTNNLPVTANAPQPARAGLGEVFVASLVANGSGVVFCTYHGGSGNEWVQSFHFDPVTNIVAFGGQTGSPQTAAVPYPLTPNAIQLTSGGGYDGYVCEIDLTTGQRTYSSYYGGSELDSVTGVHRDSSGMLTLALGSWSGDWTGCTPNSVLPTSGLLPAYDDTYNGPCPTPGLLSGDVHVAQLLPQPTSTLLHYATWLGGPGVEWPWGVHVDSQGIITVAGGGESVPTTPGSYRPAAVNIDAFVARLDPSQPPAQQLVFSTFLGGSGYDNGLALHVDSLGTATIVGVTDSTDLPSTTGAFQPTHGNNGSGGCDGFVSRVESNPASVGQLAYMSYVQGGVGTHEWFSGVHATEAGVVSVVGFAGDGVPIQRGPGTTFNGGTHDALILRLVVPGGLGTFGNGCNTLGAHLAFEPASPPLQGTTWITRVESMLPNSIGFAAIGFSDQPPQALAAYGLAGCDLHVSPSLSLGFSSDPAGLGSIALMLPTGSWLAGREVFLQAAVLDPAANSVGFALTHAGLAMIR